MIDIGMDDLGIRMPGPTTVTVVDADETFWKGTTKEYGELLALLQTSAPLYRVCPDTCDGGSMNMCAYDCPTCDGTGFVQVYPKEHADG